MPHGAVEVVKEYAEAVFQRAREPMEPLNFAVNWADQPSRHKTYPGTCRVPLVTDLPQLPTLGQLLTGGAAEGQANNQRDGWTLDRLATLLRLSYGVLDRRLMVNWNQDLGNRVQLPHAVWGRATASGGGMYPVEIYLVAGGSGELLPGVYHYATGHHSLERLLTGDLRPVVRSALTDLTAAGTADSFLLATIKFWKNSFKYNSFCYHVVTQDLGALLGSWDLLSAAMGMPLQRMLSFSAQPLDELLGLDSDAESVFAVVPLPGAGIGHEPDVAAARTGSAAQVEHVPFERSHTVSSFPQVTAVHRAAMAPVAPGAANGLPAARPADLAGDSIPLPPVELAQLDQPLSTALRERRTSFGRFRRPPELTAAQVGTTLAFAAAGQRYPADVKQTPDYPRLTRLWLFANHIDGLAAGTYAYCPDRHALQQVKSAPDEGMSTFLQQQYFLTNYTMEQVGAVIAISGRLAAVLAGCGPRGYRILNAEVGTVAQYAYCATTAQRIGCGAVLGFDNVAMNEALGLASSDEQTVLFLLLGRQPDQPADLAYSL